MFLRKFISISSLFAFLAVPMVASAGFTLVDHPDGRHSEQAAKIVHTVTPGSTIEDSLVIENTEDAGVTYVAVEYAPTASGGHTEMPKEWIEFSSPLDKVVVKAGELTYLDFVIEVPEDAAEATYQLNLTATEFSDDENFEGVGVNVGVGKKLRVIVSNEIEEVVDDKDAAESANESIESAMDLIGDNIIWILLVIVAFGGVLYVAKGGDSKGKK